MLRHSRKGKGSDVIEAGAGGISIPAEMASKRQVLFDISGRVVPGQLMALMGPSGEQRSSRQVIHTHIEVAY